MKTSSFAFASALAVAAAAGAHAQTAPPVEPSAFSANVALTTKYKFRGQDQGNTRWLSPAIQGGFDWTRSGFYLGNWNSNVSFSNAAIEMDFYGGYRGELAKDLGFDLGVLQYVYPQTNRTVDFDVTEIYAGLTYRWVSLKYSHTVSKDYFGIGETFRQQVPLAVRPSGRNTGYLDFSGNVPLADKLTLNAHLGYTRFASGLRDVEDAGGARIGVPSYWDYKLGVTYDLGSGFSTAAAYVGANRKSAFGDVNQGRAIFTIARSM